MQEYQGLKYKPSDVNPQGRPRVYFCCHEDDFERLFEPFSKEILDIVPNASIWYYDPKEGIPDDEAYYIDLSQMQLFVVPVTWKFIYKECHARNAEFAYAIEHHIPVLPLMQETGLENDFNKVCGNLQMLDKEALRNDPTAIPYEEKLKTFLNSILISDETAKKIREAFDAYIFLSYRKKDRVYAQSIMRLIHENDFCRDVAIWYDEFLTPGENFNKSIQEAMKKSVLFTLVVTPSLLEKPNYIEEHEYPEAMKSRKPMLPIEAVETDNKGLSEMYEGISTYKPKEVEKQLGELLKNVALQERKDDPVHNFLIGLAYLSGVDVEVNHERAIELITSAAEADLPEAYEKLVSMYNNGEGVERNYHTAIEWQKRYVEYLKKKADKESSEKNLQDLFTEFFNLYNAQLNVGNLISARESANSMIKIAKLMESKGYPLSYQNLSLSYIQLGNIYQDEGKLAEALEYFQKSRDFAESIYEESKSYKNQIQSYWCLSFSYWRIGDINRKEGNLEEAREWYQKALEAYDCIVLMDQTNVLFLHVSFIYDNLGKISLEEGKLKEARQWYQNSLEIRKSLYEENKTIESCICFSTSYLLLGNVSKEENKFYEAKEWYQKSLEIAKSVYEQIQTLDAWTDISLIYGQFGALSENEGKLQEARKWHKKSLEILESIYEQTQILDFQERLLLVYYSLGFISEKESKLDEAKKWYEKALEMDKSIFEKAEKSISSKYHDDICTKLENIQETKKKLGEDSVEWYQKSLEIRIYEGTKTVKARFNLLNAYNNLADCFKKDGDLQNAENWYNRCLEIGEPMLQETADLELYSHLSVSDEGLTDIRKLSGEFTEAKAWCIKCIEYREKIYQETGNRDKLSELAAVYKKLGDVNKEADQMSEAIDWYTKSKEIRESLYKERHDLEDILDLVYIYRDLFISYSDIGLMEESQQWHNKYMETKNELGFF